MQAMEIRYCAYFRKSSESDDRQALSLPAQEDEIKKLASKLGITLVATFKESKSAKKPGRPAFNEMISLIGQKKINGILVWHPNRLSRNSVDSGAMIYLMDQGLLQTIVTPSRSYVASPTDRFFLGFEWGQAKLENDNKSVDVKRGMTAKAKMGWLPAPVPEGYKNTPQKLMGYRTIVPDIKRFPYLKSCWYSILQGKRPVEAYEEGCRAWKEAGGTDELICRSGFYRMISNPFFYGEFEWPKRSGNWYHGRHKPMVTKEVFDLVQAKINPNHKSLRSKHDFPYRGLFFCGDCSCMVSGSRKFKFNKSSNTTVPYDYYRCSHKSLQQSCVQPPISKSVINEQLEEIVKSIRIPKEFLSWANKWSSYLETEENKQEHVSIVDKSKDITVLEKRSSLLLEKLLDGTITDVEYKPAKKKIADQINILKSTENALPVSRSYRELLDEMEFGLTASQKFNKADDLGKGRVVRDLGSNFLLKDRKVSIQLKNSYYVFSKVSDWSIKEKEAFDLTKYADILSKRPDLVPSNPMWLPS